MAVSTHSVPCGYTAISRKVVGKKCTRQSRKVIWDMINTLFLTTVAVEPTFVVFLALANISPWPPVSFLQIFLKNSDLKTTHNVTYSVTSPSNIYLCNRDSGTAIKSSIYFLSVSYDGHYHQFLTQLSELVIFLLASQNMNTTPCETLWVESLLLTTYLFTISLNYFQLLRLIRKGQPELRLRLQAKPNAVSLKACENGIVLHYV